MSEARPLDMNFVYPSYDVSVSREQQADKLACCNVDPGVFGDYVDITHFAVETILAAKHGGASINGSVHVSQLFEQFDLIRLGESLRLSGQVSDVQGAKRGDMITCSFELTRPNGEVPLKLSRTSLRADPDRMSAPAPAAPQSAPDPAWTQVAHYQLEPDKVARYSTEAENLIHSDPQVAARFGFKAPIAGGLMAARMMMAYLWRRGPVRGLQMSVRFRRPMFWDDGLALKRVGENDEHLLMLRDSDAKIVNEAHVSRLERV